MGTTIDPVAAYREALVRHNAALEAYHSAKAAYHASFRSGMTVGHGWKSGYGLAATLGLDYAESDLRAAEAALAAARANLPPGRIPKLARLAHTANKPATRRDRPVPTRPLRGPLVQMTFRLSPDLAQSLREAAETQGRTITEVLEEILRQALPAPAKAEAGAIRPEGGGEGS